MTHADFDILLERRLKLTSEVLGRKASEYATEDERLHNFKMAALMTGMTPEQALMGMLVKHLVSVIDTVREERTPTQSLADEKIGDCVNYLILLEALFAESRRKLGI